MAAFAPACRSTGTSLVVVLIYRSMTAQIVACIDRKLLSTLFASCRVWIAALCPIALNVTCQAEPPLMRRARVVHEPAVARQQPVRHRGARGGHHARPGAADHRVHQPAQTAPDTLHHRPQQGTFPYLVMQLQSFVLVNARSCCNGTLVQRLGIGMLTQFGTFPMQLYVMCILNMPNPRCRALSGMMRKPHARVPIACRDACR